MRLIKAGVQKLLNLFGLFSVVFVLSSLDASTFANFRNIREKNIQTSDTFKDFQTTQVKNMEGSEFFSSQQWNSYEPLPTKKLYISHKPKIVSSLREKTIKDVGPKVRIVIALKKVYTQPKNTQDANKDITIDFFTTPLSFNIPPKLTKASFYPQTQKGIGNFFRSASYTEYNYLLSEIKKVKKSMNLNDWGLYLLVDKISDTIYENRDNSRLFTWFIFNKLGYNVRAGILRKHIVLAFKTKQIVNYTLHYKINDELFFVLDKDDEKGVIYTYSKDYPNAYNSFDLSLNAMPNFNLDIKEKELRFNLDTKEYIFNYKYNQNLIDFLATYPQAQSDVFLNAPLDDISYQSIGKNLKEYVDRKKASTAINFILHFTQNAFKYQNDIEQFKSEKFMFAQETLYYDRSDAEDRVALFSYLIRKFFSFSVVGIKYKDHLVAGLYIPILGDSVTKGKKRYVIADPTYNNANIGQSIAKYRHIQPIEFIELSE